MSWWNWLWSWRGANGDQAHGLVCANEGGEIVGNQADSTQGQSTTADQCRRPPWDLQEGMDVEELLAASDPSGDASGDLALPAKDPGPAVPFDEDQAPTGVALEEDSLAGEAGTALGDRLGGPVLGDEIDLSPQVSGGAPGLASESLSSDLPLVSDITVADESGPEEMAARAEATAREADVAPTLTPVDNPLNGDEAVQGPLPIGPQAEEAIAQSDQAELLLPAPLAPEESTAVPAGDEPSVSATPATIAPPPVYAGALGGLLSGRVRTASPIEQLLTTLVLQDPGPGLFLDADGLGLSLRVDKTRSAQDAPPLFLRDCNGHCLIAVMDGMGGSGGTTVTLPGIADQRPNAYFASRLVARSLMDLALGVRGLDREHGSATLPWFAEQADQSQNAFGGTTDPGAWCAQVGPYLHRRLAGHFADCVDQGLVKASRMRGRMVKDFPTTVTMALVSGLGDDRYALDTFNCGDSRVYVLEPAGQGGLAWLTLDSIAKPMDAMACLKEDPPITAMISGSKEEALDHRHYELRGPFLLLACSDGFHHYHTSPLDLEVRLLECMRASQSASGPAERLLHFGTALIEAVAAKIEDDVTVALRFVGRGPAELIDRFVTEDDQAGRSQAIRIATQEGRADDCWQDLRGAFERYLPVPLAKGQAEETRP